jgi:hypothetical protein
VCGCAGARMCGFSVPVCGCAGARMWGCGGAQAPCRVHKYHVGSWYLVSSPPPQYQRASSVSWQLWALLGSTHVAIINLAMSTFLLTAQPSCDNSEGGQSTDGGKPSATDGGKPAAVSHTAEFKTARACLFAARACVSTARACLFAARACITKPPPLFRVDICNASTGLRKRRAKGNSCMLQECWNLQHDM